MSELQEKCFAVIGARDLSTQDKIRLLTDLMHQAEDFQRAATESNMMPCDGLQNDLRLLELSLQKLRDGQ